MKNKILSFMLFAALILSFVPQSAYADTITFVNADFENYEGNVAGTQVPEGFTGGTIPYEGEGSAYSGFFSVLTEKGTSVSMESNRAAWHELVRRLGTNVMSALEISIDINLNDYNSSRTIMVRGTNKDGADQWERSMVTVNKSTGEVVFDSTASGLKLSLNTWYTLKLTYNIATKFCLGQVLSNDGEVLYERYFITTYGADKIASVYFNYIQSSMTAGVLAKTYIDNYSIKQLDGFGIEIEDEFDFAGFTPSEDGQSVPEGLLLDGGVANTKGLFLEDGKTILRSAGLSYAFPMEVVGEYAIMADITPKDASGEITLGLASDKVLLKFDGASGKIMLGDTEVCAYEAGKKYSVLMQADTVSGKVKALISGEEQFSAEGTIPAGNTKFSKIGIWTKECDAEIENIGVYSVNALICTEITPSDESGRVIPEENIYLTFSNKIASFGEVIIGGDIIDDAKVEDGKKIVIPNGGKFTYGESVKISITDIKDIFSNTLNLVKDIKVAPREEFKPISLKITSGTAVASTNIYINDDTLRTAYLILATYDNKGVLTEVKTDYADASYGKNPLSAVADVPEGGFAEGYLWSGFENIEFLAEKAVAGNVVKGEADTLEEAPSFVVNRDTAEILAGGIGLSEGRAAVIILKQGKTLQNLKDNPDDTIAYIREFDKTYTKNGHIISLGDLSGTFTAVYQSGKTGDWELLEDGITLYSATEVEEAKLLINGEAPDYDSIIMSDTSLVLGIDNSKYSTLDEGKEDVAAEIFAEREKMTDKAFASVSDFADTYYKALSRSYVNGNIQSGEVRAFFEEYEKELYIDTFLSFDTYKTLSSKAKDTLFSSLADGSYEKFELLQKAFDEYAVLSAITYVNNSGDVTKILKENVNILDIDMSLYEKLLNPQAVNSVLDGEIYESTEDFKDAFNKAVKAQRKKENQTTDTKKPQSSGGGTGGGGISFSPQQSTVPQANSSVQKVTFTDLKDVPWAKDAIENLFERKIISGKSDSAFCPNDQITREEFAKLLVCAFFGDTPESSVTFSDVEKSAWYYKYIAAAYKNGIISGKDNGSFGIGENITREDMAVMALRAMGAETDKDAPLADFLKISDYARGAVAALYNKGIIKGKDGGNFAPKDNATRAEAAVIIHRILETEVSK